MDPIYFFASSDIVIIGNNPELADYTNPRGEIYGYSTYVIAEDSKGYRRCHHVGTHGICMTEGEAMHAAVLMAEALNARLKLGKLPVAFDTWLYNPPAYGSEAYIQEDCEQDLIAWEIQQDGVF